MPNFYTFPNGDPRLIHARYIRIYQCFKSHEVRAAIARVEEEHPGLPWQSDPPTIFKGPLCVVIMEYEYDAGDGETGTTLRGDFSLVTNIPRKELRYTINASTFATAPTRVRNMTWK